MQLEKKRDPNKEELVSPMYTKKMSGSYKKMFSTMK
jgi:hypothetical protein